MKFFVLLSRALVPAVIACLMLVAPASADDAAKGEDSPFMLESVKVTARKKEENAQDVPMSMQVLTGDDLGEAGVDNFREAIGLMPNVVIQNNTTLVIRGNVTAHGVLNVPVGYYVDGVSYSIPSMRTPDLYDVERMEVLKGPQSTLYGHNAESGVVNIITKQPDNEFRSKVFASYGNYNSFRLGGNASGPLVEDKLYLGLALLQDYTDGYMKNIYTDEDDAAKKDRLSGRATLRWTPSDPWDVSLKVNGLDADDNSGIARFETGPNKTKPGEIKTNDDYTKNEDHFAQSARIKYSGQGFEVVSVTAHSDYTQKTFSDSDYTATASNYSSGERHNEFLSQELRLSSVSDGPWDWLFGLYGHVEETDVHTVASSGVIRDTTYTGVNLAAFSQVTYTLLDSLHLNAGLRYDHLGLTGNHDHTTAAGVLNTYDNGASFDEVLPKFSVSYDVNDDVMVYATVAQGYLSGGYISGTVSSDDGFMYKPEYSWNYELGVKSSWLDKKLLVNLTTFFIDMQDKQVMSYSPALNSWAILNASTAYSQGLELEVRVRPVQGLDLFGGLGYTEARVQDWTAQEAGGGTYTYDGLALPNVPKFTGNAGVAYYHETGLFGRLDMNFQTESYSDAKNAVKNDKFAVYNARLGYDKDGIGVTLWCKNLFDEVYTYQRSAWGNAYWVKDAPSRELGITVSYIF